jgi:hypothetical protein
VDALDLLFRRLVLAARAAAALERPIEVGELLDTFVPYRSARRDGLLETNDDYLHVVMRLISGERDLVFADDLMQDDLKAELASPNPDLTVIRTYAHTKLRLATEGIQRVLEGNTEIDLRPPTPRMPTQAVPADPASGPASGPVGGSASEPVTDPRRSGALFEAIDAAAAGAAARATGASGITGTSTTGCPYCAQALPEGRSVKFCPSCGQNLLLRRCPGCSAEIESGWKFCVTCGRNAS